MCVLLVLDTERRRRMLKKRSYSTRQVAAKLRVSFRTLNRWLALGKVRASTAVPLGGGRTLWRWNEADIAKARKVKAAQKPGPKPVGKHSRK